LEAWAVQAQRRRRRRRRLQVLRELQALQWQSLAAQSSGAEAQWQRQQGRLRAASSVLP
jgi:hypothetical protein